MLQESYISTYNFTKFKTAQTFVDAIKNIVVAIDMAINYRSQLAQK